MKLADGPPREGHYVLGLFFIENLEISCSISKNESRQPRKTALFLIKLI